MIISTSPKEHHVLGLSLNAQIVFPIADSNHALNKLIVLGFDDHRPLRLNRHGVEMLVQLLLIHRVALAFPTELSSEDILLST
jgi:hypothetical protein